MDNSQSVLYPDLHLGQDPSSSGEVRPESRPGKPRLEAVNRQQMQMRAVEVDKLIAEDHPARAIWEFVGRLDLRSYYGEIRSVEGRAGRPSFDPQLLISLWVYSYSRGVGSARAIARLCESDPAYQWLTGMEVVNAHTLSDFRVQHGEALKGLFEQVLGLLSAEGLITLERVMQDGTKIKAAASSNSFGRRGRIEESLKRAREHVDAVDRQQEEEFNLVMVRARERARQELIERLELALKEFEALREQGCGAVDSKVKVSTTDPQARVMKQGDGGFAPNFNVQISTDAANGLIVGVDVTQAGNDLAQLQPAVDRLEETLGRTPEQMVADGGYVTGSNIVAMANRGIEFIGPQGDETDKAAKSYAQRDVAPEYRAEAFVYDSATNSYRCPQGKELSYDGKEETDLYIGYRYRAKVRDCRVCLFKAQCCSGNQKKGRSVLRKEERSEVVAFRKKMRTEAAKAIYRQRSKVAEFPNLWIKEKLRLRQFAVRGLRKVGLESLWACLTYNIQQWIRLSWRPTLATRTAVN